MRRRPLLRAAVVGGSAYAVGRHVANKSASQTTQEDGQDPRADSGTPQAATPELLDQLNRLDALHQQGALTDSEFTAAKARLLA